MNIFVWVLSNTSGTMTSFGLVFMQDIFEVGFRAKDADDTEDLLHTILRIAQALFQLVSG